MHSPSDVFLEKGNESREATSRSKVRDRGVGSQHRRYQSNALTMLTQKQCKHQQSQGQELTMPLSASPSQVLLQAPAPAMTDVVAHVSACSRHQGVIAVLLIQRPNLTRAVKSQNHLEERLLGDAVPDSPLLYRGQWGRAVRTDNRTSEIGLYT